MNCTGRPFLGFLLLVRWTSPENSAFCTVLRIFRWNLAPHQNCYSTSIILNLATRITTQNRDPSVLYRLCWQSVMRTRDYWQPHDHKHVPGLKFERLGLARVGRGKQNCTLLKRETNKNSTLEQASAWASVTALLVHISRITQPYA